VWKDFKKAFPLGLDKNGNPNCPACQEGAKRAGMLPTFCPVCGADRSADNWEEANETQLKMRLEEDLQSMYLTEALQALHPTIIQVALEQFAAVAIQRKADRRININRVIEILRGRRRSRIAR